jgi:hypothetical protein
LKEGINIANEDKSEGELVLKLGVEGGGVSIYRTPLVSGGWQFHEAGSSMWILDDTDEELSSSPPEPVQTTQEAIEPVQTIPQAIEPIQTIQDALRSIAKDGSWVFYSPILIHPDYRIAVRHLVHEILRNLPDNKKQWWIDKRRRRWQQYWRPEPRRRQGVMDLFGNLI